MSTGSNPNDEALRRLQLRRIEGSISAVSEDRVIVEAPIALSYNGQAYAVMMATPVHLDDFALGFSLSEGIVQRASEWRLIEVRKTDQGICIDMHIPQARFDLLRTRQRHLIGNSSCGVCGTELLQTLAREVPYLRQDLSRIDVACVRESLKALASAQPLNHISGGVHAAAYVHADGMLVREDVGRHNALDKVIGARAGRDLGAGFAIISSRASWELVQKTAAAGIPLLAAVSAPTSAAVDLAEQCGLTLIAFARNQSMNFYTHAHRLIGA